MYLFDKIIKRSYNELLYAYLAYKTKFYYNNQKIDGKLKNAPEADFCDLAVVAFNNSKVIEYQIKCLKAFFDFPYRYTVFDNSNNEDISIEIKNICEKLNTCYIKLPKQTFLPKGMGSYSHGIACNFLYNKFIKNGGAKYFGIIDHDIFPIKKFNISYYLEKQFFYGSKHRFYIWPGFWFMRMDYLIDKRIDFRPSFRLNGDTGASHAPILFKNIDFSNYLLVKDEHRFFDESNDIFDNGYSYFDCGWIHCWNGSNYMGKKNLNIKMNKIFELLDSELKKANSNN